MAPSQVNARVLLVEKQTCLLWKVFAGRKPGQHCFGIAAFYAVNIGHTYTQKRSLPDWSPLLAHSVILAGLAALDWNFLQWH